MPVLQPIPSWYPVYKETWTSCCFIGSPVGQNRDSFKGYGLWFNNRTRFGCSSCFLWLCLQKIAPFTVSNRQNSGTRNWRPHPFHSTCAALCQKHHLVEHFTLLLSKMTTVDTASFISSSKSQKFPNSFNISSWESKQRQGKRSRHFIQTTGVSTRATILKTWWRNWDYCAENPSAEWSGGETDTNYCEDNKKYAIWSKYFNWTLGWRMKRSSLHPWPNLQ